MGGERTPAEGEEEETNGETPEYDVSHTHTKKRLIIGSLAWN